jgi:hypothetical protein
MALVEFLNRSDVAYWRTQNAALAKAIVEKAERSRPSSATFLSHSTKDQYFLPYVIRILENHGADVYVDKKDPALPPFTDRSTAKILRDRIQQSRKLVILATENSKKSSWVPWELGLADGYKNPSNVAIFPAIDDDGKMAWTNSEYIGIYDKIVYGGHQDYSRKIWMVWNRDQNTATELSSWLGR